MLSLNPSVGGLVLPQLDVPDFIDSSWEPLPVGKSRSRGKEGRRRGERENSDWNVK